MRILIDARKAFDSGIGTYIRHVIPRVVALRPDLQFSALIEQGGQPRHDYFAADSVTFVEASSRPLGLQEQVELRRVVRSADLFWATSLAHPLYTHTPLIATVHDVAQLAMGLHRAGDLLVKTAARYYFRSLRSATTLMLFNSNFTRSEFRRYVGEPMAAHQVTPLGVETRWFGNGDPPTGAPMHFVCIGNLRPHKNLALLMQSFLSIKDRVSHDLIIVGRYEASDAANRTVADLLQRSDGRIRFTGLLSDAELRRTVADALALVVPSLYEGFGLPALEAMAAGVPVLAAEAAALPEVCGDCASYFDPRSEASLATQMLNVVAWSTGERQRRIAQAKTRAATFTWDKTARLTAEALAVPKAFTVQMRARSLP